MKLRISFDRARRLGGRCSTVAKEKFCFLRNRISPYYSPVEQSLTNYAIRNAGTGLNSCATGEKLRFSSGSEFTSGNIWRNIMLDSVCV